MLGKEFLNDEQSCKMQGESETGSHPSWANSLHLGFFSGTSLRTRRLVPIFYGNLRPAGAQTVWLLRFMLQLTTLYCTLRNKTHKKNTLLQYRSIFNTGIVEANGRQGSNHSKRTPPWWSRLPVSSGMAFVFPAAPPRQPLRKGLTEGGVAGFN